MITKKHASKTVLVPEQYRQRCKDERHTGDFNCLGETYVYQMSYVLNRVLVLLSFVSYTYICSMRNIS